MRDVKRCQAPSARDNHGVRRKSRIFGSLAAIVAGLALAAGAPAQDGTGEAVSIELSGTIDPATEAWMGRALEDAADDAAELVIVRLDTPGGLDTSMREIVKDIIAAPMPVVVYVSPNGARAASAGLFITQAADVAAMAPQTNIGSASPITIGGEDIGEVLGTKIENDAAAYVRALTEEHGRNPELAEEMVRDATNVTAAEALEAGLIDIVAADTEDLLEQLDGFEVQGPKATTLDTEGLTVDERDMPFQYEVLQIIVNPNVAFLLILAGIVGLLVEIFSPGLIVPGATGLIALIVGLFASSQLPVTAAGVVLLILGVGLLIAETQLPTAGIMGVLGVVSTRHLRPPPLRHQRGLRGLRAAGDRHRRRLRRRDHLGRAQGDGGPPRQGLHGVRGAHRRRGRRARAGRSRRPGLRPRAPCGAPSARMTESRSQPAIECESKRSRA